MADSMSSFAHTVPGVEGVYKRTTLFDKRKELMNDWADCCLRPRKR